MKMKIEDIQRELFEAGTEQERYVTVRKFRELEFRLAMVEQKLKELYSKPLQPDPIEISQEDREKENRVYDKLQKLGIAPETWEDIKTITKYSQDKATQKFIDEVEK